MSEKKPRKRHVSPLKAPGVPQEASEASKATQASPNPFASILGASLLVWKGEAEVGEWQTSTWKRWCTECQRYRIYHVTPNAGREPSYYAAVYLKDGIEQMLYHDRLGPGYPKKYTKLEEAVLDVEKFNKGDKTSLLAKSIPTKDIPGEKKPGILEVLRRIIKTGTAVAPVSFAQVVKALKEAFPERDEDALSKSAKRFLPDMLGFPVFSKNCNYWVDN